MPESSLMPLKQPAVPSSTGSQLISDYTCVSTIHHQTSNASSMLLAKDDPERYIAGLPVVSFHLTDEMHEQFPHIKQASVSTLLRIKGWILPNYPLPPNEEKIEILRAVIRESFSTSPLSRF
jgi:glutamate decarboxylase